EAAEEQIQPDGPEADVRQRDDDAAAVLEQIEIAAQNADRPGQMFEYVRENDDVESPAGERVVLKIGMNDFAHARARHSHGFRARLDSGDAIAALLDVLRGGRESTADVENIEIFSSAPQAEQTPVDVFEVLVAGRFIHGFYLRISVSSADRLFARASALSMHTSLLM